MSKLVNIVEKKLKKNEPIPVEYIHELIKYISKLETMVNKK